MGSFLLISRGARGFGPPLLLGSFDPFESFQEVHDLPGVEGLMAMESTEEAVLFEHPVDGHLRVAREEVVGVSFEAVPEGPVQFAVADGEDDAVVEFADGGVLDVGGVAAGAGFIGGRGFGGHGELAGV